MKWTVNKIHDCRTIIKADGKDVCDVFYNIGEGFYTEEEGDSNAKLIASAPDLLKAGIAALKLLEEMNHHKIDFVRGSLRNAIEKATGQESQ